MSSHGPEMEREFSDSSSLSSRSGSEMGSHYSTENGVFMSTFAATVFLSGVVTLGVSLLSLIIALTVMLQSCEKNNSGIVETYAYSNNYDYCKNLALHAELNGLSPNNICKDANAQYIRKGQYTRDLNDSIRIAEDFFTGLRQPRDDSRDYVMMDGDDLILETVYNSQSTNRIINIDSFRHDIVQESDYLKHAFVSKLYLTLRSNGWPLILFSRKPEKLRNVTVEFLTSVGCHNWSSLVMRKQSEVDMAYEDFLSREKERLHREGFRIIAVISSRMDALRTRQFGDRFFKIPNPIFFFPSKIQDYQAQKI